MAGTAHHDRTGEPMLRNTPGGQQNDRKRLENPEEVSSRVPPPERRRDRTDVPLSRELLGKINAYWRAANYLSVGQIYLYDNPLLKEP